MHESEKWKWSRSVGSDPQRLRGLQPSRLLHPLDFPGKSTGVGCHCLLNWIHTNKMPQRTKINKRTQSCVCQVLQLRAERVTRSHALSWAVPLNFISQKAIRPVSPSSGHPAHAWGPLGNESLYLWALARSAGGSALCESTPGSGGVLQAWVCGPSGVTVTVWGAGGLCVHSVAPKGVRWQGCGTGEREGGTGLPGGWEASCAVPAGETSGVYPGATPLVWHHLWMQVCPRGCGSMLWTP